MLENTQHRTLPLFSVISAITMLALLSVVFLFGCGAKGTLLVEPHESDTAAVSITAEEKVSGSASTTLELSQQGTVLVSGGVDEGTIAVDVETSDGTLVFSEAFDEAPVMPKLSQKLDAGEYRVTARTSGASGRLEVAVNEK